MAMLRDFSPFVYNAFILLRGIVELGYSQIEQMALVTRDSRGIAVIVDQKKACKC